MKAILYIKFDGKLQKASEMFVPDGISKIELFPEQNKLNFTILGMPARLQPKLYFNRYTGATIEDTFGGALFVAEIKNIDPYGSTEPV